MTTSCVCCLATIVWEALGIVSVMCLPASDTCVWPLSLDSFTALGPVYKHMPLQMLVLSSCASLLFIRPTRLCAVTAINGTVIAINGTVIYILPIVYLCVRG